MAVLILVAVFSFVLPIGLLLWWNGRKKTGLWPFLVGALCFILFAMVLEVLLHRVCLAGQKNAVSAAITASPVLYTLYGIFAAGIFEETGRLFGFKLLLKKRREAPVAVAYGIGHGGIEVILVLGVTYMTYLFVKAGIPVGGEAAAMLQSAADAITLPLACVAMLERISAVMLHIGLSMLVFRAAKEQGKFCDYPLAILLHAAADTPAVLYQLGILRSIAVIEGFTFVFGLACLLLGCRVLKNYHVQPETGSGIEE